MSLLDRELPGALLRREGLIVCLLAWLGFVLIPLTLGEIGISWDALNHHIYLGWTAEHPRFDRDFVAAGYQSYQLPYLYWPVYKLASSGWPGAWAGAVLATIQLIVVPPVWMLSRFCMPGQTAFDVAMRFLAVVLAFMTGVVLSIFDSTSNDLMAAAPLVWALALAMEAIGTAPTPPGAASRLVGLSGLCAGAAVACKLSNGPLAILLPVLWVMSATTMQRRVMNALLGPVATMVGFALVYGFWGTQLWNEFGNPIYPFYDDWVAGIRSFLGYSR